MQGFHILCNSLLLQQSVEGDHPSPTTVSLYPQVDFPDDPGLRELPQLFDADWLWRAYRQQFGKPGTDPCRIRIRQFSYNVSRIAIVSYELDWHPDEFIPSRLFTVKIERGKPVELFRYPEDSRLPGLRTVADPETARRPISRYILAMPPRRVRVELIRYRPASRAVLRHSVNRVRFYARVMRPNAVAPFLKAQELVGQSSFVVPRLAGNWAEGGVVWMSEIPGKNLRRGLRQGKAPDPTLLLDGLETLWNVSPKGGTNRPFNLPRAYRRARRSFMHHIQDSRAALRSFNDATKALDPFIRSWHPSGIAHNDFYDDQMLLLGDGRIALVDFEEAGPGDPMLDVGNFLAHLQGAYHFGRKRENDARAAFCPVFRHAALERFRWSERELAFREAACLFRMCTNFIRHPQSDWLGKLEAGLSLVNETLG